MEREITFLPYSPHSYVNELPDVAWAGLDAWQAKVIDGDIAAQAQAYDLDVTVTQRDYSGARTNRRRDPAALFFDLALAIYRTGSNDARLAVIEDVFGAVAKRDVWFLIKDAVEEQDMTSDLHDLEGRIMCRIESGHWHATDLAWVQRRAAEQVTDEDMLNLDVFSGDQGDARELSRRVVRARRDHMCHWSGLPIAVGERHLVIREMLDGEFLVTRHSVVACWFGVYGGGLDLAEAFKRDEAPLVETPAIEPIVEHSPAPTFEAAALREAYRLGYDRGTYDAGGDPVAVDYKSDRHLFVEAVDLRNYLGEAGVAEALDRLNAVKADRIAAAA